MKLYELRNNEWIEITELLGVVDGKILCTTLKEQYAPDESISILRLNNSYYLVDSKVKGRKYSTLFKVD